MSDPPGRNLWILGAGRVGLSLGLALHRARFVGSLWISSRSSDPPRHPLFESNQPIARLLSGNAVPDTPPDIVVLAVPDAAIAQVAGWLADVVSGSATPVLHTSGAFDSGVLEILRSRGNPAGSIHPLVSLPDPIAGADRLTGAWFALEGDALAIEVGRGIVRALEGKVLTVDRQSKPLYHAAAVFASNYLVAILAVAERLAVESGAHREDAREALTQLARGAVDSVADLGPVNALTGPISRGDESVVRSHLSRLSPEDAALYSVLARATLAIARDRGLSSSSATSIELLLRTPRETLR